MGSLAWLIVSERSLEVTDLGSVVNLYTVTQEKNLLFVTFMTII